MKEMNFARCYVNGKKSALYIVDNNMYLLSFYSKYDDGTRLSNMRGFQKCKKIGAAESNDVWSYNRLVLLSWLGTSFGESITQFCLEGSPEYDEIRSNVKSRDRGGKKEKKAVPAPTPTPTPEPVPEPVPEPEPTPDDDLPEIVVPEAKQTSGMDAFAAFSSMFSSVEKNVTTNVIEAIKPYLSRAPQLTKFEVTSGRGVHDVTGITHKEFKKVSQLVEMDIPVYLYGAAGSGKNVLCHQVAEALGLDFHYTNNVTQEYKLTGFIDGRGEFHETEFYKAFKNGGLFMLDEIDASIPEVLVILNAAIANKYFEFPNGRIEAHKDFRVVAAGNTCGTGATVEYTGRYQLDAATLNRFAFIHIDYDENIENALAGGDEEITDFVRNLRKVAEQKGITIVLSYRQISQMAKLKDLFKPEEILRAVIVKEKQEDEIKMLASGLPYDSNKFSKAFKSMK